MAGMGKDIDDIQGVRTKTNWKYLDSNTYEW